MGTFDGDLFLRYLPMIRAAANDGGYIEIRYLPYFRLR